MGVIETAPAGGVPADTDFVKDLSEEVNDKGFVVTSTVGKSPCGNAETGNAQ